MTNQLLADRNASPVGNRWASNFVKRHKSSRYGFFNTIAKYGIDLADIYNFGEVGFLIWYRESNLPDDWVMVTSTNYWIDNELGLEWLKHFDRSTSARSIGNYRLLTLNGYKSHHSLDFEKYREVNKIVTLYMPPHSLPLLKPLDVGSGGGRPLSSLGFKVAKDRPRGLIPV
ncbi:hypothetical protein F53441_9619 [Fusarium austroafricanum]|uniref:DDE-1 domain-containing protein n=1 Tax=Fusarium austroafricanum TaxID=2364996 RepID=A0A8H4KCG3_9HYPO|nr:hypothetical protein F53441_9619 [Fusarium austroafricanum]